MNLPGLNHNTPLADAATGMQALQSELYHYEGSVNKLSVDEKGVTLVAALGLPPLAHEDDAVRGVLAGLAMQSKLTQLGWRCSIGVTSGRVFCGTIGNEQRCEYTIIGDIVNLAARLMQAARGASSAMNYDLRQPRTPDWEALPPIMVKGKPHPIPVFKPLGAAAIAWSAPRATQTRGTRRGTAATGAAPPQALQVAKPAAWFSSRERRASASRRWSPSSSGYRQRAQAVTAWLGTALAMERSTPYFVWRPIFRRLLRLDSRRCEPRTAAATGPARTRLRSRLAALAPLLDVVLSLDFRTTPETAAMFGEVRLSQTQ